MFRVSGLVSWNTRSANTARQPPFCPPLVSPHKVKSVGVPSAQTILLPADMLPPGRGQMRTSSESLTHQGRLPSQVRTSRERGPAGG